MDIHSRLVAVVAAGERCIHVRWHMDQPVKVNRMDSVQLHKAFVLVAVVRTHLGAYFGTVVAVAFLNTLLLFLHPPTPPHPSPLLLSYYFFI